MSDTLKIKKSGKSKYGYYLLIDDGSEKGSFKGTTEKVSNYLSMHIPCEVEVQESDEKGNVTRVNILGEKSNESGLNSPAQLNYPVQKPVQSNGYVDNQRVIRCEFCVREALRAIEIHNQISDEKMNPTRNNILETAKIIDSIIDDLSE